MTEVKSGDQPILSAQERGNLKLASQFIRELVARIEADEIIPESGTLVFLPPEDEPDPELAAANLRMADEFAAEGRNVIIWTIGKEEPFASAPAVPSLTTTTDS
jgi:hypothetical protein